VRLLGKIPHSEIHLLHNAADVFTLPSIPRKHWQEQFGIVLIESMACQTPVVSTLCGSIPEVVGNCGALVQPNDHIALYEGLKRLITNEELRKEYGQKGRERVERLFSPDAIGNRLRQAYDAVLQSSFDNQPRHR
jgi:glycosyltransferase involved in cell wall biosynthesis